MVHKKSERNVYGIHYPFRGLLITKLLGLLSCKSIVSAKTLTSHTCGKSGFIV